MYSPREMRFTLLVISLFSRMGSRVKNYFYDTGIFKSRAVPLPVISVGNIAFGGTGKTPLAMELVNWLLQNGRRPALVSRGYKGTWERRGGVLSDGLKILGTWREAGDEPFMVALRFPRAGVFIGKDRFASCCRAEEAGFDTVVLDDGFQHRRLRRDLDIVLFSPGERTCLREPLSALRRADVRLVTGRDQDREEGAFSYTVDSVGFFSVPERREVPRAQLVQKKVVAFCGIARPQRFLAQVQAEGLEVVSFLSFPDHHAYPRHSLEKISRACRRNGAEAAVTSEKDSVKITAGRGLLEDIPVFFLRIGLNIKPGFYDKIRPVLKIAVQS